MAIRHKFNAIRTERDGIRFDSKLEANYCDYLRLKQQDGSILFFLRQVPIHVSATVTLRIDFVVFYANGEVTFEDTKGIETEAFKIKRKLVEAQFPFRLVIIKKIPVYVPLHKIINE